MSFEVILPFLKPIQHLLEADTVAEIMVNPDATVWIEEQGSIQSLPGVRFPEGALQTSLQVIANRYSKRLDADSPILNLRLPDGSRLAAMIPPIVNPRPLLTIRKFTSSRFKMPDLIERQMLTCQQATRLDRAVHDGDNILISGSTGSGKTTILNVLAAQIPDHERILVLEDTAEIRIAKPHVISAEAQLDTYNTPITFADLLKAALRHRPDRIIVGEIRGSEARVFLDALNTGHKGSLTTIHANGAEDALRRSAQLASRSSAGFGFKETLEECRHAIRLVAHIARKGSLRVVEDLYVPS
jgi:pilus assembly protein CpaF